VVVVIIPTGMAARICVDTRLAVSDLSDSYRQRDDVYSLPGYSSADNCVDLEISQAGHRQSHDSPIECVVEVEVEPFICRLKVI